ncbi:MAG: hypothetical protein AAF799_14355 [Myxococcota bacterium]
MSIAVLFASGCAHRPSPPPETSAPPSTAPQAEGQSSAGAAKTDDGQSVAAWDEPIDWFRLDLLSTPPGFTPHTNNPASLEPTARWLSTLCQPDSPRGGFLPYFDGYIASDHQSSQDHCHWGPTELNRLAALDLAGLPYEDAALSNLAALSSLRALNLADHRFTHAEVTGGTELSTVAKLEHLEHLHLANYGLDEAGFDHVLAMKRLRTLDLRDNDQLPLGALSRLAELPNLERLSVLGSFGIDSTRIDREQQKALRDLLAARPGLEIEGFHPGVLDGVAEAPTETLAVSLSIEDGPQAGSDGKEFTAIVTIRNESLRMVRLSSIQESLPGRYRAPVTNTHSTRFVDGSTLHFARPDGTWAPLQHYDFPGAGNIRAATQGKLLRMHAGDTLRFELRLAYDEGRKALLVRNPAENVGVDPETGEAAQHTEYGVPASPGEVVTLGFELSQDPAVQDRHNDTQRKRDRWRLTKDDWGGTIRTDTIRVTLPR